MTIAARRVICGITCLAVSLGAGARAQEPKSVAIVSSLNGTASVTLPSERRPTTIRLFQWLPAGSAIEVAPASKLTLVFSSGARYELGPTARVTAGLEFLASSSGPVRHLEAVPPLPQVSPIAGSARASARSGAVRIRGTTITGLYPHHGAASLAETTVLRFTLLPDASRYRVDVETQTGTSVFHAETRSPTVAIPSEILKPGAKYYWQVRTLDRVGQGARGAAEFVTLEAATVAVRATLTKSLNEPGDASSLALLAEIDRSLGLLVEARERFRAAVAKAPRDVALRQSLDRLEEQLTTHRESEK